MKLLHTSDWHVGKTIRGNSRADEHVAVLDEIVGIAGEQQVDLVLVAGDLFESAAPTAEAEHTVYDALLRLADTGAELAVISGNHDNARRLEALAPVFEAAKGIHMLTRPRAAADGGVRRLKMRTGEDLTLAMLPFVSKRGIVRAEALWDNAAFENSGLYTERVAAVVEALAAEFRPDTVNVLMAHTFVHGSAFGGGERMAHFVEEYALTSQVLPTTANYIALGHVHRPQKINAGAAAHYCGSPLQMDFGEEAQVKQVNIVELAPGVPAKVDAVTLTSGRRLRTITGALDQLGELAAATDGESWIKAVVTDVPRAGLADDVRTVLGDAVVDIRIEGSAPKVKAEAGGEARLSRSPQDLFKEYLSTLGKVDPRIESAFADLLDRQLTDG